MDSETFHWLAGLLEGEGSFMAPAPSKPNLVRVHLNMCDEEIVKKVADLFEMKYATIKRKGHDNWSPQYQWILRGSRAVKLMRDLYPLMSAKRQAQIDRALTAIA